MKTSFFIVLVVIFSILFTSCEKSEVSDLNPNKDLLKTQLSEMVNPDQSEVIASLSVGLKSAELNSESSLVRIYPVQKEYYEIYDTYAVKYFVLYRFVENYRKEFFTFKQVFDVVNGEIVDNTYSIIFYSPGCPFSKQYRLENTDNVSQMRFFIRENSGMQSAYISESTEAWRILIPQLANVEWQMQVVYSIDGMEQTYQTDVIDYDDFKIKLRVKIGLENIASVVEIDRRLLMSKVKSIRIVRVVNGEEWESISHLNMWSNSFPEFVSFPVPFKATAIYLCGEDCNYFLLENEGIGINIVNGRYVYRLNYSY